MNKRILSVFMALCILLGCMSTVFASEPEAKEFSDMPENWATEALESAVANGLLRGADGKIMPDSPLTRAQMAAIIVRAFAAIDKSDISTYVDVRSSDWFADDIAKADKMGVMQGYGDGIMNPNGNITREQAFTVLARALKLAPASDIDVSFQDVDEISEWAKGPVYALVNAGYVQGSNGRLNPKSSIRRDEFAQLMYNLIKQYITDGGEYTEVAEGNIMVNAPGVTLKGVTIDGDLIIGDGVGDGEVILDDVIVTGRLVVRGGGENSIIIRGSSSISNVIVARVDGVVRVFVDDGSEVGVIYVDDGSDDVIVEGSIGRLEVGADSVTVTATDADINSASISGVNSAIIVDADSNIESIEISGADASVDVAGRVNSVTTTAANTSITGKGTVRNVAVQAGADGAAIETPKTKIQVDEGVTGVTGGGGAEIEAGKTVENNADGTGVVEPGAYVPWVPTVTYAEVSNATAEVLNVEFNASFINYEDLTITRSGATVTISGDLVIEVTSEDTVTGFGPISQYIKDGQLSTRYALIAWMMDNEEHVWIIGNATKSFTVEFDGVTYTIDIGGLNWDKVTKVTKEQLKAENFTDDSVKKVNYDNLTVEQLGSKVTIKSNNLVKVTQADSPIAGFGSFTIPTEGIKSDKFALIAWIIGDEPHIWLVGNATEEFSVEYNGIEYTIDISGLDWADPVTEATKQDLLSAEFTEESVNSVNYGNLDVTQEGANITITGGDLVRVENGDEVAGFGKISIPDGVQSKAFGLIAWKIGTEPHIWLVGNATEEFTVVYRGITYTIDITGLDWTEKVTNATDTSIGEAFDLETINYAGLEIDQDKGNVTITGKVAIEVTADQNVKGFGLIGNYIPENAASTQYALIAWKIGTEPHIWLVGNATEEFPVEYNGIEYTIDVSGLIWADSVTNATEQDLLSAEFTEESVNSVNYDNLDVAQKGTKITITGGDLVRVENGDEVEGFGKISIPDGVQSEAFGLIAWMIGEEPHIWLVGNATESFEVTWNGFTYTIDITGLVWEGV